MFVKMGAEKYQTEKKRTPVRICGHIHRGPVPDLGERVPEYHGPVCDQGKL